ncbi:MAG: sensor histidine kinase [Gammaproteobacteria bacterium]
MSLRRLRILLLLFFSALAVPTIILVYQAYGQLKWEAFHQHQQLAREMALRIETRFSDLIEREESRSFSDYSFLNVTGSEGSSFLQRSPLSGFPLESDIAGLIGYFQVDAQNQLATPIVPQSNASGYGISAMELNERVALENRIRDILDQNRLVKKTDRSLEAVAAMPQSIARASSLKNINEYEDKSEEAMVVDQPALVPLESTESSLQGQLVFDQLKSKSKGNMSSFESDSSAGLGRVDDLKLEDNYEVAASQQAEKLGEQKKRNLVKQSRKETAVLPENLGEAIAPSDMDEQRLARDKREDSGFLERQQGVRIQTFETEVDPLEFSLLDSGHFVLFRRVWRDGERYVQGMLLEPQAFVDNLIAPAFRESVLSSMSDLILAYQGDVIEVYNARYARDYMPTSTTGENELLYSSRLVAPFGDIELIFSLARLPVGAGSKVIVWVTLIIGIVLLSGFYMLYRLGARQIALGQQQQDFVAAVSHELKTPLTSIRMYGEMLREGWADETRKKSYYDFIFNESERLSRLINNVLHLARMTRNEQKSDCKNVGVDELLNELCPKLESQLERAGFNLELECADKAKESILSIDSDWFTQVLINLIDNAIKFSATAEIKKVQLHCRLLQDGRIQFSVRDFGPGVAKDQMKKIFKLFYRSENELTRETVGTGIGLALVHQLVVGMGGEVDVVNCEPGVEFRIRFPVVG